MIRTRTAPPTDPCVLAVSPALGPLPPLLVTAGPVARRVFRTWAVIPRVRRLRRAPGHAG